MGHFLQTFSKSVNEWMCTMVLISWIGPLRIKDLFSLSGPVSSTVSD